MKKIILSLALLNLITVCGHSQPQFGVNAAGLLTSMNSKYDGKSAEGEKSIFGFKAGGIAKVPLSDQFCFMPELNIVSKGGKFSSSETMDLGPGIGTIKTESEEKVTMFFIEIPLNFAYSSGTEGGFFGGLGPVISLGISGKDDYTETVTSTVSGVPNSSQSDKADIKFDGKKDATDNKIHLKGLEFGGNIFAGYQLSNGFFIRALYHMGISNLSPEDKTSVKTSYFGIGVGFLFGGSNGD